MTARRRLRLSLGTVEVQTLLSALRYMEDTWANPDDPYDPEDKDLFRRLAALREHVRREKREQRF